MIVPYIAYDGTAEEAFNFYKVALNGTILNMMRFGDTPQGDQLSALDKQKIMHVSLEAPGDIMLMGNDHLDFMGEEYLAGNNFSLTVHPQDKETADRLFNNLSVGGTITVPMSMAPWGDYFGMFYDKFDIKWMINFQARQE